MFKYSNINQNIKKILNERYKNISNCRICRSKEIETLFSLFEIPIPEVYEKIKNLH